MKKINSTEEYNVYTHKNYTIYEHLDDMTISISQNRVWINAFFIDLETVKYALKIGEEKLGLFDELYSYNNLELITKDVINQKLKTTI